MSDKNAARIVDWISILLGVSAVWTAFGWSRDANGRLWLAMLLMFGCNVLAGVSESVKKDEDNRKNQQAEPSKG